MKKTNVVPVVPKQPPKELQPQTPLRMLGKVVAVRGHASGVNIGVCGAIGSSWVVLLSPVYYMKHWDYDKSKGCFGSFHALANGNLTGGDGIEKYEQDFSIHAIQHVIECEPTLLQKADKYSIPATNL